MFVTISGKSKITGRKAAAKHLQHNQTEIVQVEFVLRQITFSNIWIIATPPRKHEWVEGSWSRSCPPVSHPRNQGDRTELNSAERLSSYLFLLPTPTGHSVLSCPEGPETGLDTAQIVAGLDQIGLIFHRCSVINNLRFNSIVHCTARGE